MSATTNFVQEEARASFRQKRLDLAEAQEEVAIRGRILRRAEAACPNPPIWCEIAICREPIEKGERSFVRNGQVVCAECAAGMVS